MTTKKTLLISIASGLLAVILSAVYLHLKEIEVAGGGELRDILVAVVDIKTQTLLEPGMVAVKKIPRAFVQPDALTVNDSIDGRVSIANIKKSEQIIGTKLVMGGAESGVSFKLPKGMRAVSIAVSDSNSAGGLIQPDDRVDIIVTFNYGDGGREDKYTYTLFQNIPVLAVGNKIHSIRNPEGIAVVEKKSNEFFGSLPGISTNHAREKVLTLALEPIEAQRLIYADSAGEISVTLRSPTDRAISNNIIPVKLDSLTGRAEFTRKDYREYKGR